MTQSKRFSSGIELAPFVTSSGLIHRSWDAISSRHAGITSFVGVGLTWKVHEDLNSNLKIIAFEATPYSNLQPDLVSSSALRERNFHHFDFLCSKGNELISFNSTAVSLFYGNHQRLDQLKSEVLLIAENLADAFSSSVDATITPLLSSVSVSSASPIENSSSIAATAITAFDSPSAAVGSSPSEISTASAESSSLFLMHDTGKDSIAKLEWKSSSDPFIFGQFRFQSKKTSKSSLKSTTTARHTSSGNPLSSVLKSSSNNHSNSPSHNVHRSLTFTAANKVKQTFDSKSPCSGSNNCPGSGRVRPALLRIFAYQVGSEELLQHIELKVTDAFSLDYFMLSTLLNACAGNGSVMEGHQVHTHAVRVGLDVELNILINSYGYCMKILDAQEVFDKMTKRDVISLVELTVVYARSGDMNSAQNLFDEMAVRDFVSWSSMITAYVKPICCQADASTLWLVPLVVRNRLMQSLELYTDMEIFFTLILSRDKPKGKE
ncbi:Tetratricopeptide-like helical domain superfamily, partial [Sesbania bispinosa]